MASVEVNHKAADSHSAGGAIAFLLQIGFAATIGVALFAKAGAAITFAFTPLSAIVAAYLITRAPVYYPGFCMWLWMLAPLVRRLADWETSYNVISPVTLAPLLASALSMWTVVSVASRLTNTVFLPFFIVLLICVYGVFVGTLQGSFVAAVYACLSWIAPVCVGIHILAKPRIANQTAKALCSTMAWGALVMGIYGVWQYFEPQPWDIYWMLSSEFTTAGRPLPQEIRVFSTMNSPSPFAYVMMGGLVVLLVAGGKIRWLATPAGLTAFMLSSVRSAWGGLVVAFTLIILSSKPKQLAKYVALAAVLILLTLPLLTIGPIADVVQARLNSVSAIEDDHSYQDRVAFYGSFLETALTTPFGAGLGMTGLASRLSTNDNALGEYGVFDSGIMDVFFTFGWLGGFLLLAVGRMILLALKSASKDSYSAICAAIAAGTAAQMMFSDTLEGASGMLVFPFAALCIGQAKQAANSLSLHLP